MNRQQIITTGAVALSIVAGLFAYNQFSEPGDTPQPAEVSTDLRVAPGALTAQQLQRLGIQTQSVDAAVDVPLGPVPAVVTLPPEAQVAVTAPFDGAILRVYVIQGEMVRAGQPLATVKSREPLQYGAELARAQARLGLAQATAARTRQLVDEGIIAGARGDEVTAQIRVAQTDVSENARILRQAGASSAGEVTLRAPISGRVAAMTAQVGGPVMATSAPFVIENSSAFTLDLQLPERLAGQVRPGMSIRVNGLGTPEGVTGTIVSVGGSLDPATRSVLAKARIDGARALVAGKSVMATINGTGAASGTSIPATALTRIDGKDHVFVRTGKRFVKRAVEVAGSSDGKVFVTTGLKPGEQVAVLGLSELKMLLVGG
ncbi:efflux RND transporter periplasmic adaptor subunit [Blastomonas sp.]|uniref:efflux RND transporter periplasmic adaptor subunit n=1 Tax=Blastomonas sp. TaxID=1909299 RepID=UPI0026112207|nr:efflux RND transporter periplasmic adaptor subunit [Blastomonas sp.]MDM7957010.1 efflux RND transporter periplasmic adaptor subunit [Blastomonas sp.]